jgi:hypothetical protein
MTSYGSDYTARNQQSGDVVADGGATLLSPFSEGETAIMAGPALLREIQAGVANGDFAVSPQDPTATISAENNLPYWTFTDVNSAGAITCAIVADAGAGSGNVLRFTVASGTLTGKSATLTRYVPVASSASRSFSFYAEATFENGTLSSQTNAKITCQFYKADQTTTTGTAFSSATVLFSDLITAEGLLAPDFYSDPTLLVGTTAPADAAYLKITITIATVATQSAARTVDLTEVRLGNGLPEILFTDRNNPTNTPGYILCADATMALGAPTDQGSLRLGDSTSMNASVEIILDSPSVKIFGANSEYVARVTATAAQSLTNNTVTKITFNTASATPDIDSYDPNGWFNNTNDRIVIGQDGFYNISANVGFATNATSRRLVLIYVNGVQREGVQVTASSAGTTLLSISTNLYLVADDYVEVHALQQSGGALNTVISAGVTPFLSVGRIGA